jgi:hypothetical protein
VPGGGACALQRFVVFPQTTPPISTTTEPGRPGVASDGNGWLVVTCRRAAGAVMGDLAGALVSASGTVGAPFHLVDHDCQFPWPSVAFDGTNYLVVFNVDSGAAGQIRGMRVTPAGALLDAEGGFPITSGTIDNRAVAFGGTSYLVVFERYVNNQYDVYAVQVQPDATVSTPFPVLQDPGEQIFTTVSWTGSEFLAAWRNTPVGEGPVPYALILGTRISASGSVLNPGGMHLGAQSSSEDGEPSIAPGPGASLLTWVDTSSNNQLAYDLAARLFVPGGGSSARTALTAGGMGGDGEATSAFDGAQWVAAWSPGAFGTQQGAGMFATRIDAKGVVSNPGGVSLALPECPACRSVMPDLVRGGSGTLLVWVDNSEDPSTPKSVQAVLLP